MLVSAVMSHAVVTITDSVFVLLLKKKFNSKWLPNHRSGVLKDCMPSLRHPSWWVCSRRLQDKFSEMVCAAICDPQTDNIMGVVSGMGPKIWLQIYWGHLHCWLYVTCGRQDGTEYLDSIIASSSSSQCHLNIVTGELCLSLYIYLCKLWHKRAESNVLCLSECKMYIFIYLFLITILSLLVCVLMTPACFQCFIEQLPHVWGENGFLYQLPRMAVFPIRRWGRNRGDLYFSCAPVLCQEHSPSRHAVCWWFSLVRLESTSQTGERTKNSHSNQSWHHSHSTTPHLPFMHTHYISVSNYNKYIWNSLHAIYCALSVGGSG